MLKMCLVFWESEPQYAYKRYAYKKKTCRCRLCDILFIRKANAATITYRKNEPV